MDARIDKFALTEEDLDGIDVAMVRCKSCSPFCAERQPVFWDGKPLALCSRKPEGRAVINRWKTKSEIGLKGPDFVRKAR